MDVHTILVDLAMIIGFSTVGAIICHFFKIPSIVGFIVTGVIIGPSGLAIIDSLPGAKLVAELGVIFLLFTIGLELSINSLRIHKKLIIGSGLSQLILTTAMVFLVAYYGFDLGIQGSLFWGFMLSLSSTAIVMKMLVDARETNSTHGKAVTGILLSQDMAVIPMTLALPLLAIGGVDIHWSNPAFGTWLLKFVLVAGGIALGAKFIVPRFLELAARSKSREIFFFATIIMCLGFALAFESLNLSLALGAFLSGLLISESPFGRKATSDVMLLRDTFLALFFCSVGMILDLMFIAHNILKVLGLALLVMTGKFLLATLAAYLAKVPLRSAVVVGAMVFQVGEFSFVLAEMGRQSNLLSPHGFQYFLAMTVFSMILTPFSFQIVPPLILRGKNIGKKLKKDQSQKPKALDALIIGFGVVGEAAASSLKENGFSYHIIEHNYSLVKKATQKGEPITFGDGADLETLLHHGLKEAKIVIICVAGVESTRAVLLSSLEHKSPEQVLVRTVYTAERTFISRLVPEQNIVDSEDLSKDALSDITLKALTPKPG